LKIFFGEEVRRIPFPTPKPTWGQFQSILRSLFTENYHPEVNISYQDEEGDQIIMSTEIEWSSAYDFLSTQSLSKITLKLPQYPFSEGPPPQPLYFYVQNADQQNPTSIPVKSTNNRTLKKISNDLPACLAKLFPDGKLLPYHLPEWFRPAVNVRRSQNQSEADLDINIDQLFNVLHTRALFELEQNNIDAARNILQAQCCISSNNTITLYNLACCEALDGHKSLAIEYLRQAIANGYENLDHMMKDSDLASIREEPEFLRLTQDLLFSQINSIANKLKI